MTTPNDFDDLELDEAAAADVEGGINSRSEGALTAIRTVVAAGAKQPISSTTTQPTQPTQPTITITAGGPGGRVSTSTKTR